jgi:hypothetical protein
MPLIAVPSNDTTRTALTKLLEAIIATQTTDAKVQIFKEVSSSLPESNDKLTTSYLNQRTRSRVSD